MSDEQQLVNVMSYVGSRQQESTVAAAPNEARSASSFSDASGLIWSVLAAHVVELRHAGVIDDAALAAIGGALISALDSRASGEPGTIRDLAETIEARVEQRVPVAVSSIATLGLSREEWLSSVNRMLWRGAALEAMRTASDMSEAMLDLANAHVVTIMPAHIGGRTAQPTTLAHYLGGVLGPLRRSRTRIAQSWLAINRSPLGAGMLAGDVVAADRSDEAERLGFDEIVPNTFDAVASVEDVVEVVDAIAASIAPVARLVRELSIWIRTDAASFFLDEAWLSRPEPAHPTLEHSARLDRLQADLDRMLDILDRQRTTLRRIAYGPLGTVHDVVFEMGVSLGKDLPPVMREARDLALNGIIVNRAYLGNRAGRDYTTSSDLAAFLMTEEQIAPEASRRIAVLVLSGLKERGLEVSGITPDMIDSAALMTIGREVKVEMESLGRFLAPRRYIERRQVSGSPAPEMAREWLAGERTAVDEDNAWLNLTSQAVEQRLSSLRDVIAEVAAESPES